jgi:predicted RNA-binding Zn ribbon-like protein
MTGQMLFDSHVATQLDVTVALVNRLTPGLDGGHRVALPADFTDLRRLVSDALHDVGHRVPPSLLSPQDVRLFHAAADSAREAIEAVSRGDLDAAATVTNDLLQETAARPQLDRFRQGEWGLHFHGPDDSLGVGWTAGIAIGLALALGSKDAGRLGVCEAAACDRVYVDTSRNGGRRFCSTRCQNRMKSAAHRARRGA